MASEARVPGGGYTASTVSEGRSIYITSETGKIWVIEADTKYAEIATNELDDNCLATPAIADGTLYFRSQHSLIAIGDN